MRKIVQITPTLLVESMARKFQVEPEDIGQIKK